MMSARDQLATLHKYVVKIEFENRSLKRQLANKNIDTTYKSKETLVHELYLEVFIGNEKCNIKESDYC